MANKTLIIKMDPSATFTGGSTASSGIATYNNKIITGVGEGSTNLTLNFASSKISSRTFNKVFNIKVSKSKLQILQDEYNAAVAALTDIQNWFRSNVIYYKDYSNVIQKVKEFSYAFNTIYTNWADTINNSTTIYVTSSKHQFDVDPRGADGRDQEYWWFIEFTVTNYNNKYAIIYTVEEMPVRGASTYKTYYNGNSLNATESDVITNYEYIENKINTLNNSGIRPLYNIALDIRKATYGS